jgi:glycosyltransferase involved in cell wall biosynthesis
MKTKKPVALIYNWHKQGEYTLRSEIYHEDNLCDEVVVYSLGSPENIIQDVSRINPDVIMSFNVKLDLNIPFLVEKYIFYPSLIDDVILANDIVVQSTFINCRYPRPKFSIFTPTYNIGEKILRTYESIKNQTFNNWEWVVLDDSPNDETWKILMEISEKDFRVKPHKMRPSTGGNIGLAKNRAASLCDGEWLVELDHDDTLLTKCLEYLDKASKEFPDAGFMYSDVTEQYDDGSPKYYDHKWEDDWYGRKDNYFDFGYAGHTWVNEDGKDLLAHHYPDINPLTIRFNISMPSHVRVWKRDVYLKIGGHNKNTPVADDFELIVRTFLNTKMVHIKKVLYIQWNNKNSTTDNNAIDINRRSRLIRDFYDKQIHNKIIEMGKNDWSWVENENCSQKFQNHIFIRKFHNEEEILNYIYDTE